MKKFIEYLVKEISTKPEEVKIEEINAEGTKVYQIHVSEDDMGVVIGKEGKNIRSLRNLAKAKAIKDNVRIQIILEESLKEPFLEDTEENLPQEEKEDD